MGDKSSKPVRKTASEPHRGVLAHTLKVHKDSVLCLRFSPDGRYIASCSSDKTLAIWETHNMKLLQHIKGHKSEVSAISFSPDSTQILSCSKDCKVSLWNVKKGERIYSSHIYQFGPFMNCSFSLDSNKLFATSSERGCVTVWDMTEQKVNLHSCKSIAHTCKDTIPLLQSLTSIFFKR